MALDQQYRKMLRDLMLGSDALSGQQTLPDGSIIGYDANTPDDMIAAVANPQPPMPEIQQQQIEQPRTPQRISDLLVSQRPQDFGDQQRFDEAYQFKQQMPEGQSYLRNNTTGAVQTLPSGQRQSASAAPSNAFNDLIRFGQVNSIDPATIGRLIKYQSSVQAGMPSAKDLYTASFKYNKPIGEMLDYYGAAAAGQSAQNTAQMQGEKDRLGLEKQRLELAQARGGDGLDPEVRKQASLMRMYNSIPEGPMKQAFGEKHGFASKPLVEEKPMTAAQRAKFEDDFAKDYSATQQTDAMMKNIVATINGIKKSTGLESRVGYSGYIPAALQGQDAKNAQQRIDTLKGKVTQMGKAMATLSGAIGPMAVQEWKIVSDAIEAIDPTSDNFGEQLSNIESQAVGTMNRQRDRYERQYVNRFEKYPKFVIKPDDMKETQSSPEGQGLIKVKSVNDAMKLKSGTRFIDPNGVERVRP